MDQTELITAIEVGLAKAAVGQDATTAIALYSDPILECLTSPSTNAGSVKALLDADLDPPSKRIVAWSLVRFVGAHPVNDELPEIRLSIIRYIRAGAGDEMLDAGWDVDFDSQSYRVLEQLSTITPRIERELELAAASLTDIADIGAFRERFLRAISDRQNAVLTNIFIEPRNKALLHEALDVTAEYSKSRPEELYDRYLEAEDAVEELNASIRDIGYEQTYLGTTSEIIQGKLEAHFAAQEYASPGQLEVSLTKKEYRLHDPGTIDVRVAVLNSGHGTSFDVELTIDSNADLVALASQASLGRIDPQEQRDIVLPFKVNPGAAQPPGSLGIDAGWRNFDRGHMSDFFELQLNPQDPSIDWDVLLARDPYSLSIAVGQEFVGRRRLLDWLTARVTGTNMGSAYVWGQKRVGKTSLVRELESEIRARKDGEERYVPIYVETIREESAADTVNLLGHRLARGVLGSDPRFADIPEPEFHGSLTPLIDLLDTSSDMAHDVRFIFILDEFDELPIELYLSRGIADAFFQSLGKGIAQRPECSVILVGGERVRQIISHQGMRLNTFRPLTVDHFSRDSEWDDFRELVRRPASPLQFDEGAIEELWTYCAGHPYFLKEIASRVVELMVDRRDAYVTSNDVLEGVRKTLSQIDVNSFAHFWADGILEVDPAASEAESIDRRNVLLAYVEAATEWSSVDEENWLIAAQNRGCSSPTARRHITEFIVRNIVELTDGALRFRVKLFAHWLSERGAVELRAQLARSQADVDAAAEEDRAFVTDTEIADLVRDWPPYQSRYVSESDVREWLKQFGQNADQRLMFRLLAATRFYSQRIIRERLRQLHSSVSGQSRHRIEQRQLRRRDILVSFADSLGKSGPSIAKLYVTENRIWHENVVAPESLSKVLDDSPIQTVVFVDDFVGTGKTGSKFFTKLAKTQAELCQRIRNGEIRVFYVCVAGLTSGLGTLRDRLEGLGLPVDVLCGEELEASGKAFNEESPIWAAAHKDRARALEIAKSWGDRLEPRQPLGYGDCESLVVFEHNCPNNTLPILYKNRKGGGFRPLFPRSS